MNFWLYVGVSAIEGFSVFTITLAIFRYNVLNYVRQAVVINLLIAVATYTFRQEGMSSYTPILTFILLAFFISILANIKIYWSVVMAVAGYISFLVLQTVVVLIAVKLGLLNLTDVQNNEFSPIVYTTQFIVSFIVIFISYTLYRKGLGFAFDFTASKAGGEKYIGAIIAAASLVIIFLLFFKSQMLLVWVILLIILAFLLHILIKKESEDD